MDYEKEIPFGAFDSELMHQEISIPEGFIATIEGNKIILKKIESEDERISKEIIKYLEQTVPHHHRDEVLKSKEWTAWLEKQGEQKHAEWSKEDDNCLSIIIAEFSKCSGRTVSKDTWMRCNDFLNSLKDRVSPQPKQEWNEEDEEYLNFVIDAMKILQVKCTENEIKRHSNSQAAPYYGKVINWLKSLKQRIGWKPSDEQMDALWNKISNDNLPNSEKEISQQVALTELYEQLKKLKGE